MAGNNSDFGRARLKIWSLAGRAPTSKRSKRTKWNRQSHIGFESENVGTKYF